MDITRVKICDIFKIEYPDFYAYCESSGKVFVSELSNIDFVAFRTRMEKSREYIAQLKAFIDEALLKFEDNNKRLVDNDAVDLPEKKEDNQVVERLHSVETAVGVAEQGSFDSPNEPQKHAYTLTKQESDKTKKQKTSYDKSVEYDESIPLSSIFEVDPNSFLDVSFEVLNLSVRSFNCLNRSGCRTMGDLLLKSISDLKSIKNMGLKSVNEILAKIEEQIFELSDKSSQIITSKASLCISANEYNEPVKNAVELILLGENISTDGFNENQVAFLNRINESVEVLGSEICMDAYTNPQYVKSICESLREFSSVVVANYNRIDSVCENIYSLPTFIKERKAIPFISAYISKTQSNLTSLLSVCDEKTTISQITTFRETLNDKEALFYLEKFVSWLNFEVEDITRSIISLFNKSIQTSKFTDKTIDVIESRASGQTLEEIGSRLGMTRERVRQIEKGIFRKFWMFYKTQKYDLIMIVYALRDGDDVLYLDDLKEIIGESAFVLWDLIKYRAEHELYFYSKDIDAIVIRNENENEKEFIAKVNKALDTLPDIVDSSKAEEKLINVSTKYGIPLKTIKKMFYGSRKKIGNFYTRTSITVVYMCNYVLKHRFPAGYKIGDSFESDRFRQYAIEFFGERASSMTNRSIDAKVGEIGVLCDRGKYIHPDFLQIDNSIIDAINEYVENSPRSVLTFGEIFDALSEILNGTQITNRYLLQGALKKYGCKFNTSRDFIRKTQNVSFVDELDAFVEERGIVYKSEILSEFTSLNEANLGQVVARSSKVFNIENGYYIHASLFDIQPEDYKSIREYLVDACNDIPVNIRSAYDAISVRFPDFMYRNDFDDRNKLFAALNYMFRDEFNFSRPYIAKLGVREVTNKSVILQHIVDYDHINIDELINICNDNDIRYVSSMTLIQQLAPEFVRTDSENLIRRESTGITDDVVNKAVEIITDMLKVNDYIVASKIYDFLWFPEIELDWNEFLLENLVFLSDKINIVYLIGDPLKHSNAVFVCEKYKDDTFDSLLIKLLTKEVKNGSFLSKEDMHAWLKEEGFIEGKMPNFLESEKYFYVNGTGVHCAEN